MVNLWTYSELLLALVRSPQLSFNNQFTPRPQLKKHSAERSLETGIAVCQVNPFGDAQCQNHIILFALSTQVLVITGYIVALQQVTDGGHMRQSKLQFYYSIAEYDTIDIYEFNVAEYSALSSTCTINIRSD